MSAKVSTWLSWNRRWKAPWVAATAITTATSSQKDPPMTMARRITGPDPTPLARRAEQARATSCSRGCMMPLPMAYRTAQKALTAL